jgi:imidazoleglycerol phosphate synthase glutamine amidotransferase subunit HisH
MQLWLNAAAVSRLRALAGSPAKSNTSSHQSDLKIPHMGWNTLNVLKAHPLLKDIQDDRPARLFRALVRTQGRQ